MFNNCIEFNNYIELQFKKLNYSKTNSEIELKFFMVIDEYLYPNNI